jgi:UDP-sulfoquinovose synthase
MRILVLGGDGYLGWPTAMYFSARGHEVMIADSLVKRHWEMEQGVMALIPIPSLQRRVALWKAVTGREIQFWIGDIAANPRFTYRLIEEFQPEAVIHYAEQPSAPYSMMSREKAVTTQHNNVVGTLNLLFAIKSRCPQAHIVKLGTMGEYGTPNIDIEEGFITITHNGRTDTLPFPKQPGSFYHLSKAHDSHNIMFACSIWGLRSTDLNQGVVYGIDTDETRMDPDLRTSFHYDAIFGTVLNRFCVQAVLGHPLTVYGRGGQTRGFLNIVDTLQCVELTVLNPPGEGEYRVFNQFTETFSVVELAKLVKSAAEKIGIEVAVENVPNPRVEKEEHYYNPKLTKLQSLGLKPRLLSEVLLSDMMDKIVKHKFQIDETLIPPRIRWRQF